MDGQRAGWLLNMAMKEWQTPNTIVMNTRDQRKSVGAVRKRAHRGVRAHGSRSCFKQFTARVLLDSDMVEWISSQQFGNVNTHDFATYLGLVQRRR